ncbi:hypothetical protein HPB50_004486 [Hyalomma asiaticum]|uniref:Uncharacterized protein n=1 Tax=Hyalomma asiaticum TaxID=266040 RepID=A0ACB7RHM5_HYAAI|nr:hypothetical protein HPB50_004486 [Hyalomma asiaticum]
MVKIRLLPEWKSVMSEVGSPEQVLIANHIMLSTPSNSVRRRFGDLIVADVGEPPLAPQRASRRFGCSLCSYTAAASSLVERHMRTHTGERPYRC